jgi:phage gp46-like protein
MTIDPCLTADVGRRRVFWTTQPQTCGSYALCGEECVIPGLEYVDSEKPTSSRTVPRTIKNTDWLRGLVLNILNTRARTDLKCPTPAGTFGHWSESYRQDGLYVGSTLWNAASKFYTRVSDSVKAIEAAIRADMGKLVAMGLVESVTVTASYKSGNRVDVTIAATAKGMQSDINLAGTYAAEKWAWR